MSDAPAADGALFVVANRLAGGIRGLNAALDVLRTGPQPVVVLDSTDPTQLDQALGQAGGQTLVAAGGDGTLQLLAQHLWTRRALTGSPLGLVPLGTGNDFARAVGIPIEPEAAAAVILHGRPRPFDLLVDGAGAVAVNAVHCGAGGVAVRRASRLKPVLGRLAYRVGAAWAGARERGWRVRVEVDDQVLVEDEVLFVGIGNGTSIGGGTIVWPQARADDGLAEVAVTAAAGVMSRLKLAAAFRSGDLAEVHGVVTGRGKSLRISGQPIPYIVDGEPSPATPSRSWRVHPAAWRLLVPLVEDESHTSDSSLADAGNAARSPGLNLLRGYHAPGRGGVAPTS